MLDTWCFSIFCLRMPHMWSIGFRSGDILGHSITFTFTFSSKAVVILSVGVFGVVMLENSFWREGIIICFRMSQYMLESMFPSMNRSSPVPAVLMQPKHFTVFCIYITHCCILMYALNCFYLMFCLLLYVICLEQHCSTLPETNFSSGTNKVYQKTMMLPPPCLTVGKVHFSWYSSPGHRHTCWTPSESNKFTLDSLDHRTWFQ